MSGGTKILCSIIDAFILLLEQRVFLRGLDWVALADLRYLVEHHTCLDASKCFATEILLPINSHRDYENLARKMFVSNARLTFRENSRSLHAHATVISREILPCKCTRRGIYVSIVCGACSSSTCCFLSCSWKIFLATNLSGLPLVRH